MLVLIGVIVGALFLIGYAIFLFISAFRKNTEEQRKKFSRSLLIFCACGIGYFIYLIYALIKWITYFADGLRGMG